MSTDHISRDAFDAVMATQLRQKFKNAGIDKTFAHDNRIFSEMRSELVPDLVLARYGVGARIVYDGQGRSPSVAWKPCVVNFFPKVLVSDFLIAETGPCVYDSRSCGSDRSKHVEYMLRSTQIVVAV